MIVYTPIKKGGNAMCDNLKKETQLLFEKGLEDGSIIPFDDEFYEKMSHTYIHGLPVSIDIKYFKPLDGELGKCYDRSLSMFLCFPNAVLVRGDRKDLELRYGKENAGHGWIEMDGYCYDPSLLLRFKKEIYYEIYKPYNVSKINVEKYKNSCEYNKQFYEDIVNTKLSDFQPKGRKRTDLGLMIPLVQGIAEMGTDIDFKKELNDYLQSIQYDRRQVYEEMNQAFPNCLEEETRKM